MFFVRLFLSFFLSFAVFLLHALWWLQFLQSQTEAHSKKKEEKSSQISISNFLIRSRNKNVDSMAQKQLWFYS